MILQLAGYVHKLHTYVTDSIRRKRLFGARLKLVRKVTFTKVQFTENIHVTPFRLWVLSRFLLSANFFTPVF